MQGLGFYKYEPWTIVKITIVNWIFSIHFREELYLTRKIPSIIYIFKEVRLFYLLPLRVFNMLGPLTIIKKRLYTTTHNVGLRNDLHVHHQHK